MNRYIFLIEIDDRITYMGDFLPTGLFHIVKLGRRIVKEEFWYYLWVHDGRKRIWRRRNEKHFLEFTLEGERALPRIVIIRSRISLSRRTHQGQLYTQININEVLEPFAIPYIQGLAQTIVVELFLLQDANTNILPWPCHSTNLYIIVCSWNMMRRRAAWDDIPQHSIDHLIWGMLRRTL